MNDQLEKIRQYNIIWDFAKTYKFLPKKSYPMEDIYLNMVTGFKIGTFDFKILNSFFAYIKKDNMFFDDFKFMTEILMEEIAFKEISKENLVIADFRKKYARKVMNKYSYHEPKDLREQIEKAYYGKILDRPITEGNLFRDIYSALFSIHTTRTNELVDKLNDFFEKYFRLDRSAKDRDRFKEMVSENKAKDFKDPDEIDDKNAEYSEEYLSEQFGIGSAEFTGNIYLAEKKEDNDKNLMFLNTGEDTYHSSTEFIEDFYGLSVMAKEKVSALETKLCKGIHKNKRLYFTRGEYSTKANARFYKKGRREQAEKTEAFIKENTAINNRSINELTLSIKNSIANFLEYNEVYKNYGAIDSSKAWRANILHDYDVFINEESDDISKFKVDLILDGSASQIGRQAMVANEAYIIERAMDALDIPIRVMSFSTLRDFTVFNIYRDYDEKENNEKIFDFFASGSNRDGLAFKTVHELIEKDDENTKNIVIILSDGKPNDERSNINTVKMLDKDQYVEEVAVKDTAKEVRNIKEDEISILGVFTGEEEDVENAKLIYNTDFCRITNLENFSKIVSIFMKNQILQ